MSGPVYELKVGDRVVRGPGWVFCDQDGFPGNAGTVIKLDGKDSEWVDVKWDNTGECGDYMFKKSFLNSGPHIVLEENNEGYWQDPIMERILFDGELAAQDLETLFNKVEEEA